MERTSAVTEKRPWLPEAEAEDYRLVLSREEVEVVRSGLETLLQIYTRHESCRELIRGVLAKLPASPPSLN